MGHGQTPYKGVAWGLYAVLIKGLLGRTYGVVTMAPTEIIDGPLEVGEALSCTMLTG